MKDKKTNILASGFLALGFLAIESVPLLAAEEEETPTNLGVEDETAITEPLNNETTSSQEGQTEGSPIETEPASVDPENSDQSALIEVQVDQTSGQVSIASEGEETNETESASQEDETLAQESTTQSEEALASGQEDVAQSEASASPSDETSSQEAVSSSSEETAQSEEGFAPSKEDVAQSEVQVDKMIQSQEMTSASNAVAAQSKVAAAPASTDAVQTLADTAPITNPTLFEVASEEEFRNAIATINADTTNTAFTISLKDDITLSGDSYIFEKGEVTILGNNHTITDDLQGANNIHVNKGAVLNLGNKDGSDSLNLTGLNATGDHTASVIELHSATLNMYDGIRIGDYENLKTGSTSGGSGVFVAEASTFNMYGGTIENCVITNRNAPSYNHGAAVLIPSVGHFNMYGGAIKNNTLNAFGYGGGVLAAMMSTVNMYGGEISNNNAGLHNEDGSPSSGGSGGGLCIADMATFNMYGGKITDNKAAYAGGGIYFTSGNVKATFDGKDGPIEISGNTAVNYGGGIFSYTPLQLNNVLISDNSALYGAGIYAMHCPVTLNSGEISNNTSDYGGAVYVNSSTFTLNDGTISNNTASEYGAGVYTSNSQVIVNGGSVENNKADIAGGAFFTKSGSFTMNDGSIVHNESGEYGGGVYAISNAEVQVLGGLINNNTAGKGGDDLGTENASLLTLQDKNNGTTLESNGEPIDGWYYDGARPTGNTLDGQEELDSSRWNPDPESDAFYVEAFQAPSTSGQVLIKAAHTSLVPYDVEWIDEKTNQVLKTEEREELPEHEVSVEDGDKVYKGYTFDASDKDNVLSGVVKKSNGTKLKLYFTQNPVPYNILFLDENENPLKEAAQRLALPGEEVAISDEDKALDGYTFNPNHEANLLKALAAEDGSTILKLHFTKNPVETTYTIHWLNEDGQPIKEAVTETAQSGTEVKVSEADEKVPGYTFDADNKKNILAGIVAEDGSTTLRLYFTQNPVPYTVQFLDENENPLKEAAQRLALPGEEVAVSDEDKALDGYTFDSKNKANVLNASNAEDGSTVLKLHFTKNPVETTYTIHWLDEDGQPIKDAVTETAQSGTEVKVSEADENVSGYTFDADNKKNVLSGIVAEDGSTSLDLYFAKDQEKVPSPVTPDNKEEKPSKEPDNKEEKPSKEIETRPEPVKSETDKVRVNRSSTPRIQPTLEKEESTQSTQVLASTSQPVVKTQPIVNTSVQDLKGLWLSVMAASALSIGALEWGKKKK